MARAKARAFSEQLRDAMGASGHTGAELAELAGVLWQEAEVGEDELPFGVGDVAGVGLVSDHTLNYVPDWTTVHNTL